MPPISPEAVLVPRLAMDLFRSSPPVLEDITASLLAALSTTMPSTPLHSSALQGLTSPYRWVASVSPIACHAQGYLGVES